MAKEIYQEVQARLKNICLFTEATIKIIVKPSLGDIADDQQKLTNLAHYGNFAHYHIERLLYLSSSEQIDVFAGINDIVEKINQDLAQGTIENWNVFYLYKELIQKLVQDRSKEHFNYFRGQFDEWSLVPSLFRDNTKQTFIDSYDRIYSDIAKEYPDILSYVPYSVSQAEKRAEQLAMLQHYGMRTSLLDITQNPFIALQFMVLGFDAKTSEHRSTFDMYCIDEEKHAEKNVFVAVVKNDRNKRIKAQKGAFFDYDYLNDIRESDIQKIPRLKIRLEYDLSDVDGILKKQQTEFDNFSKVLKETTGVENQLSNEKSDLVRKQLGDNIKTIAEIIEKSPDLIDRRLSYLLSQNISQKLREYFYLEKNLFPDFDKYIMYLQQRNIESTERLNR